jgi:HPt (histidine-containing phosphotransfer) domain-containing protein
MEKPAPLIDYEFALKQFSGNSALLLKMFGKFSEQYQSAAKLLEQLLNEQDMKSLKMQVHTIKGVSGNLGMQSLHVASREYELTLDENTDLNVLQTYLQVIQRTLDEVNQAITHGLSSNTSAEVKLAEKPSNSKQLLLDALNRNEFITQNKLAGFLSDLSLNDKQQEALKSAIADFDYETAKRILG